MTDIKSNNPHLTGGEKENLIHDLDPPYPGCQAPPGLYHFFGLQISNY